MSSTSVNPYASNENITDYDVMEGAPRSFPRAVTVIAIIFIIFGIVGILSTVSVAVITALNLGQGDPVDPMAQAVARSQARMFIYTIVTNTASFVLSIFLVVASIALLRRVRWAPSFGSNLSVVMIVFNLIALIVGGYFQVTMMADMAQAVVKSSPQNDMDPETLKNIMAISGIVAMLIASVPVLAFYSWAAFYLSRPATRAWFV